MASGVDIEDPQALSAYLIARGHVSAGESFRCRALSGGVSSRVMLAELHGGERWVLKQALPKLRVAMDWFSDPARVHREALGLRWLERLLPGSVPAFVFEDLDDHVLAMRAVPEPHENWKSMLLAGRIDESLVRQFGNLLGRLHAEAWRRRDEMAEPFGDQQFFESLRLEPYYACSADQVPQARSFLLELIEDTRARRVTLVHGDFSPKNILVHADRLVLLDHEVIHWGDPTFDIGFAMTHLLSKAHHLPACRAALCEAARGFWHAYTAETVGLEWFDELEPRAVRQLLACLLARVAGRSPLEYLTPEERRRQCQMVVDMVAQPPKQIETLIEQWSQL